MNNRREFLKNSFLLAGALSIGTQGLQAAPPLPPADLDDDTYWRLVRAQFPLSTSRIFLNNGTLGPSPYVVLNEVQQDKFKVGTEGIAVSALRPIGKADFSDALAEVKTLGEYVESGARIRIIKVSSNQIIVESIN